MTTKADLQEDIWQLEQEIDWGKRRLIQLMWAQEEAMNEEAAIQTRFAVLEADLADAKMQFIELKACENKEPS